MRFHYDNIHIWNLLDRIELFLKLDSCTLFPSSEVFRVPRIFRSDYFDTPSLIQQWPCFWSLVYSLTRSLDCGWKIKFNWSLLHLVEISGFLSLEHHRHTSNILYQFERGGHFYHCQLQGWSLTCNGHNWRTNRISINNNNNNMLALHFACRASRLLDRRK